MTLKLTDGYARPFISEREITTVIEEVLLAQSQLINGTGEGSEYTGWVSLPYDYDKEEFERVKKAAKKIQESCDIFVVIGIGGSYLGARAVIEFLKSPLYNNLNNGTPDIYFSGCSISAESMNELLSICEGKDVCINVISKSGTTTEPAVAFRVFRNLLEAKYGKEGARERIFVTTDKEKGALKALSDQEGYETFVVPDNVGGRFSVLTSVGLLPIAVSGINIDELMRGAADAARKYTTITNVSENDCLKYAAIRNIFYRKGMATEILVNYEPYAAKFNEWWKQLYGESDGKDGKGLFPASVIFSTDLHSLGQIIQAGKRNMFETVVSIKNTTSKLAVPYDEANVDGINFIAGTDMNDINKIAMQGTILAHVDGGTPNILIEIDNKDEYNLGYLIYFFEFACGVSGYVLGVNPFNQPGVEAYKKNMFALLGKPGYEDRKKRLEARLKN